MGEDVFSVQELMNSKPRKALDRVTYTGALLALFGEEVALGG